MVDMFKKAHEYYYIMTKMIGLHSLSRDKIQKLQQYVCRARLTCKELMTDFRQQEKLLDREVFLIHVDNLQFHIEKSYIESMLLRGEDLYNYQYRQKLSKHTLDSFKIKKKDS